jgi:hypothetical protein
MLEVLCDRSTADFTTTTRDATGPIFLSSFLTNCFEQRLNLVVRDDHVTA